MCYQLLILNLLKRSRRYCLTHAIPRTMTSPCPSSVLVRNCEGACFSEKPWGPLGFECPSIGEHIAIPLQGSAEKPCVHNPARFVRFVLFREDFRILPVHSVAKLQRVHFVDFDWIDRIVGVSPYRPQARTSTAVLTLLVSSGLWFATFIDFRFAEGSSPHKLFSLNHKRFFSFVILHFLA